MKFLRWFREITIFVLQMLGILVISDGLRMIYPPISVLYCGVVMIWFGHMLYAATESEETDK